MTRGDRPSLSDGSTRTTNGLRVLGLCDHFTEDPSGGSEQVTKEVYRRLAGSGTTIRVLSAAPAVPAGVGEVAGIPVEYLAARDLSRILGAQVLWAPHVRAAAARAIDEFRPDVVHATSIHFVAALSGSKEAAKRSVPIVTTAHVGSVRHLPLSTRWAAHTYEYLLSRRLLERSTAVIAVSEAVRHHLENLGTPGDRIRVVANGVDHERFKPGAGNRPRRVIFVGRLIANKGPDLVLRAFALANVADADLLMVGDGPLRPRLERQASAAGISHSVHFLGRRNDVEALLSRAALFVRPSMTEGQSLALLEAMATETCAIASDIEPNRELLDNGRAGMLVPPGDARALSEAIRVLLEDDSLRNHYAIRGRQRALEHSWDTCAEATGRLLGQAARVRSGRNS
jgi:glycosyltransferase involved in cell wall biosynthesis